MNKPIKKEELPVFSGELALLIAIIVNSSGVVLMLYSGAGISAISSVPFAFSEILPQLSLGTWTYLFQGFLVLLLMLLQKRFVPEYLCSFLVGFLFGKLVDFHECWVSTLPQTSLCCVLYFVISYLLLSFGIALSNRCGLPIVPTDLFPREISEFFKISYSKVKVPFDILCLLITCCLTELFLGHLEGLGIGTVLAAFTLGKMVGIIGDHMDRQVSFQSKHKIAKTYPLQSAKM